MAQSPIIERFNRISSEKAKRMLESTEDPFTMYEERRRNNTKFDVRFTMSDPDGNLYYMDNGLTVLLPKEKLQETDRYYSVWKRGQYVGIKLLEVTVDRIDTALKIVYLKSGRTTDNIVHAIRRELYEEVNRQRQCRAEGREVDPFPVFGTIVSVDSSRTTAYVKIFGQSIVGEIYIDKWSKAYDRRFPEGIENEGTPLQFDLIGVRRQESGHTVFRLSAVRYSNDPWESLPPALRVPKSVCQVLCIDTSDPKHWWGKIKDINIELLANYTDKFKIVEGREYLCTVKRTGNHEVIITPFKYIVNDGETADAAGKVFLTKDDIGALLKNKKDMAALNDGEEETAELNDVLE